MRLGLNGLLRHRPDRLLCRFAGLGLFLPHRLGLAGGQQQQQCRKNPQTQVPGSVIHLPTPVDGKKAIIPIGPAACADGQCYDGD